MNEMIDLTELDTFPQALTMATEEAPVTGSRFPIVGVLYKQGGRQMINTSLSMHEVIDLVRLDSANKEKGDDPLNKRNRPLVPEHSRTIARYIKEVDEYILPPITLNVDRPIRCFAPRARTPVRLVVMNIPRGYKFLVTDGQHRIQAIVDALKHKPELQNDAICINIVMEDDIDQIHQDFADCAQTKPIPSSMLAAFNTRNPISKLLNRVTAEVPFFRGRIDKISQSVSKTSLNLFTLNQIRFCVTEALLGDSVQSAEALNKSILEHFGRDGEDFCTNRIIEFYRTFSEHNAVFRRITENDPNFVIPAERGGYVHLSATGLQVISRVGKFIIWSENEDERTAQIKMLAELPYERSNELWQKSIVNPETLKVSTHSYAIKQAVRDVKLAIGLGLTDSDRKLQEAKSHKGISPPTDTKN